MASAEAAALSPVPPSYEQAQHLRAYQACVARQEDMARLLIFVWDETGQCDLEIMGELITAHVQRHDTYHSRFTLIDDVIQRHALADPGPLQMVATTLGVTTSEEWQIHIGNTPSPLSWDCFRFGVLQRSTGFTCFASIDHLHADSSAISLLMTEIQARYRLAIHGQTLPALRPAGRYLDYCTAQRERAAAMTLTNAKVSEWISFLYRNGGRMPRFPLPLDVLEDRCRSEHVHLNLLDASAMNAFESACKISGVRIIGGLLASAALAERELTGETHYSVVTPSSTRKSPKSYRMSGWCMGLVPIDFSVDRLSFADAALRAQHNFDDRLDLASLPIERVLELAASSPNISPAATGGVMLSFMDMERFPMDSHMPQAWHEANGRVFINQGMAAQVAIWFFRTQRGLSLTMAYPQNAVARSSMHRYVEELKIILRQVAKV